MQLSNIINQLKTNAPTFVNRIAGAAEYAALKSATNLIVPAAYVIPLDDGAEANKSQTGYRQTINDSFAVVVVLSNQVDERGQTAYDNLHALRQELWLALLGWKPDTDYDRIEYQGAELLDIDRFRLDYQFEFNAQLDIDQAMTWQGVDIAAAPAFESVYIDLDHKDLPPDGVIDHKIVIDWTEPPVLTVTHGGEDVTYLGQPVTYHLE